MAEITPDKLVLRCFGHRIEEDRWWGICLDLNLAVEAESPKQLVRKMGEVIISYIEAVQDTDDKESISELLSRKAPLRDWALYYFIVSMFRATQIKDRFRNYLTFREVIPFHLAHSC